MEDENEDNSIKKIEAVLRRMPRKDRARAAGMSQSSYIYRFMHGEVIDRVVRLTRRYWNISGIEARLPQAAELLRHAEPE